MEITKEIITPLGEHKVVIKTMLTGAERERVSNAIMKYAKTEDGKTFTVTDMEKVALAEKHALLEVSVVSVDGGTTDLLGVVRKMYEADYDFVYNEIIETQKKMKVSTSPASS
ncbi:hypothetical protein K7H22_13680 [Seohaeicola saemankumensis]|uniref:hypothetical protein n=1 Tax=Seohaeicola saemankumensis TaxID=481181 RepID=UPI001E653A9D|nr:hypothetical protein [Seohaeicola saemankumensis]MCD1627047.1 hypothetical protein [Seohaeicola saemankumensis]